MSATRDQEPPRATCSRCCFSIFSSRLRVAPPCFPSHHPLERYGSGGASALRERPAAYRAARIGRIDPHVFDLILRERLLVEHEAEAARHEHGPRRSSSLSTTSSVESPATAPCRDTEPHGQLGDGIQEASSSGHARSGAERRQLMDSGAKWLNIGRSRARAEGAAFRVPAVESPAHFAVVRFTTFT